MFRRIVVLICAFLFAFFNVGVAQTAFTKMSNTEVFKTKLNEMSKSVKTIESNFTQEKNLSILSKAINSKGYFCYKKENKDNTYFLLLYILIGRIIFFINTV